MNTFKSNREPSKKNKVYLVHSTEDKAIVSKIRNSLIPFQINTWFDDCEMLPADSLFDKIQEGIDESNRALVFLSKASVESEWVKVELSQFIQNEKTNTGVHIIPVVVESVELPTYLDSKLQVRYSDISFANSIRDILKGILRVFSVITVSPLKEKLFQLEEFGDKIHSFKQDAERGNLYIVYDYYKLTEDTVSSLVKDNYYNQDAILKISIPNCFALLTAITPNLVKTILRFYRQDSAGCAVVEKIIQIVWRIITLTLFEQVWDYSDRDKLLKSRCFNFQSLADEIVRLKNIEKLLIPPNHIYPLQITIWLEYLNAKYEDCYDIGFSGDNDEKGISFLDASHVPIRKIDIRSDSLTQFFDTTPKAEFYVGTWVNNILPYIIASHILSTGFSDSKIYDTIQKIGLEPKNYSHFGIE